MSKKLPSFQFYPGDWMKDPELRSVSLPARGLWMDLLCLMHESDRRGYLQHATGKPWTLEQIARVTGCSTDEASRLLQELADSGVSSCTEHGILYSRRIVKDERKRTACKESGKKGGNPALKPKDLSPTLKGSLNGNLNGRDKPTPNLNLTPSISTSELSSDTEMRLLVTCCELSPRTMSFPALSKLDAALEEMRGVGFQFGLLPDFRRWWDESDWRGKKGQPPTVELVRSEWGRFEAWREQSNNVVSITQKKQFCGKCNYGWLPPDREKGEDRAKYCPCVTAQREAKAG